MTIAAFSLAGCPDDGTLNPQDGSSSGNMEGGDSSTSGSASNSNSGTSVASTGADSSSGSATATSSSGGEAGSSSDSIGDFSSTGGDSGSGSGGGSSDSGGGSTGSSGGESTMGIVTGGESSTGDMTTGVVFIQEPDLPAAECDLFDQDCPDEEKCMPYAVGGGNWNAAGCFPLDPDPVAVGDTCEVVGGAASGMDNCGEGVMCWDVDTETLEGVCVAMCTGSIDNPICTDPDTTCAQANDGLINLCLDTCDPLLQDCADGLACYPVGDGFVCAPDASGVDGAAGDDCAFINSCDPGLTCVAGDVYGAGCAFFNCCTPFCDTDEVDACPEADQECVAYYEEGQEPPGLENVGICAVPA